jgi:hypothetical protein
MNSGDAFEPFASLIRVRKTVYDGRKFCFRPDTWQRAYGVDPGFRPVLMPKHNVYKVQQPTLYLAHSDSLRLHQAEKESLNTFNN